MEDEDGLLGFNLEAMGTVKGMLSKSKILQHLSVIK